MSSIYKTIKKEQARIEEINSIDELELLQIKLLGKNGLLSKEIQKLSELSYSERSEKGYLFNRLKKEIREIIEKKREILQEELLKKKFISENLDVSLPGRREEFGNLHPLSQSISSIENFFSSLGFQIINGLEIEDSYHNFDALNMPINHPARTSHDTFWFDDFRLLRTQTSNIQIRVMKENHPPIRIISSGKVYRNDNDSNHTPMFHQAEGLVVEFDVSFSNLKDILHDFLYNFFEEHRRIRFRPSYFPFTEPSSEVDIMNRKGRWVEVLGCGMVHPDVLKNVNIDSRLNAGFAFGIGIERLTMLKYDMENLRDFFINDIKFLKQFK